MRRWRKLGGRRGRVGGTVKATKPLCTLQLYCLWGFFFFFLTFMMPPPPFFSAWQLHTSTYTLAVTTFIPALSLLGKGSNAAKKRWPHCAVELCYTAHDIFFFWRWRKHAGQCCRYRKASTFYCIFSACPPNEQTPICGRDDGTVGTFKYMCLLRGREASYLRKTSLIAHLLSLLSVGLGEVRKTER